VNRQSHASPDDDDVGRPGEGEGKVLEKRRSACEALKEGLVCP